MKQKKVYIDAEFELKISAKGNIKIKPISFAMLAMPDAKPQHGFFFYENYVNAGFRTGNSFIKENVMPKLNFRYQMENYLIHNEQAVIIPLFDIQRFIDTVIKEFEADQIVLVSDFTAFDWAVYVSLFGGYESLPKCVSRDPIDLQTLAINRDDADLFYHKKDELTDQEFVHNALYDAYLAYLLDRELGLTSDFSAEKGANDV